MRALLALALLAGCAELPPPQPWTSVGPSQVLEILSRHQCSSCHSVESVFGAAVVSDADAPPPERTCTRARAAAEGQGYCHVPTLASMERFRARWLRAFLEAPSDVRPNLAEQMINHDLTPAELDALILGWRAAADDPEPAAPPPEALARGEALYEQKQCGACHQFGTRGLTPGEATDRQRALAPDLQHTRLRLTLATVEQFILQPTSVKPTTEMPRTPVSADEARALAELIYFASPPGPGVRPNGPRSPQATRSPLPAMRGEGQGEGRSRSTR